MAGESAEISTNSEFGGHIEGYLGELIKISTDLGSWGRDVHEYGKDMGNKALECRLEVIAAGYDASKNEGQLRVWRRKYPDRSKGETRDDIRQVYVSYSLGDSPEGKKPHVTSMRFDRDWRYHDYSERNEYENRQAETEFLAEVGPQIDIMVKEGREIRERQVESPQNPK